uniref:Thioredoxin domain-containing protein n=1 Tax=viral metagenome TaxID=1070528 RepID=A0A6C0JGJ3_9ZZZZ
MLGIFGGKEKHDVSIKTRRSSRSNRNQNKRHTVNNKHIPKKEKDIHVVLVHAHWCGHCKALMPEWKKMEKQVKHDHLLDAKCRVVTIEMSNQETELPKYKQMIGNKEIEVAGYPTIFLIKRGTLYDYTGGRTSPELVEWVRNSANDQDIAAQGQGYKKREKLHNFFKMMGGRKTRRRQRTNKCSTCKSGFFFNLFSK